MMCASRLGRSNATERSFGWADGGGDQGADPDPDGVSPTIRPAEDALTKAPPSFAPPSSTLAIAHDFNNVLSVIISNAQFLAEGLPAGEQPQRDALEILAAAQRAVLLTKRLLARR